MISVFQKADGVYGLTITNQPKMAHKVNRILGTYPADTRFRFDEEPTFIIRNAELKTVASAIGERHFSHLLSQSES